MDISTEIRNQHLSEYIKYYCTLESPGHAVLITGAWGVGKTYQLKKILPNDDAYYVSLFGLNTPDDVISSVYTAMHPRKAMIKNVAKSIGETSADLPGIGSIGVSGLTSGLIGAFLRKEVNSDKPIIFDDLERCGLNPKVTLGLINLYVEHHGCRVIVIAHDEKLETDFSKSKEKLFGQTIRVLPEIDAAYDAFVKLIADKEALKIFEDNRDTIISVFKESNGQSLRILKHLIFDIARFSKCLREDHLSNSNALSEIIMLFSAFDIEWRAGRLQTTDLMNRATTSVIHQMGSTDSKTVHSEPNIVLADERYKGIELTSTLLDDQSLAEMFVDGVFNPETIQSSLDASPFFLKEHTSSPWRIVGSFDKLEDDIVNDGLIRMEREFTDLEITDAGEMLHVFALKLMMANNGITESSIEEVTSKCLNYIDELEKSGKLEPRGLDWRWYESFEGSDHGISYWVDDVYRENFRTIFRHLIAVKEQALEKTFADHTPRILGLMHDDAIKFRELLCHTPNGENLFASVPILASIKPTIFVETWLNAPKENWYWISITLRDRYSAGKSSELESEMKWLSDVRCILESEASRSDGFARFRTERTINRAFAQS